MFSHSYPATVQELDRRVDYIAHLYRLAAEASAQAADRVQARMDPGTRARCQALLAAADVWGKTLHLTLLQVDACLVVQEWVGYYARTVDEMLETWFDNGLDNSMTPLMGAQAERVKALAAEAGLPTKEDKKYGHWSLKEPHFGPHSYDSRPVPKTGRTRLTAHLYGLAAQAAERAVSARGNQRRTLLLAADEWATVASGVSRGDRSVDGVSVAERMREVDGVMRQAGVWALEPQAEGIVRLARRARL